MARIAIVDKKKCNPSGCGGYLCIRLCPINMKGEDCIVVGPDDKPVIDEILCTGCGICPNRCPFGAIDIINLPQALDGPPVNRYGRNGFHLYNLPIPKFGAVVGLIGRNGIGKSTALKILSNQLKPNLGEDSPATYEELHKFFKGTLAQNYFEKIHNDDIVVSFKPQQVELLPQVVKGTVLDLLTKVDEKGIAKETINALGLSTLLDSEIKQLSGGELQRLAIAAAVCKKADLYVFDEPTSFLDIKQRLAVSRFIRKLADDSTAVLVVEHDLVMLDTMTDYIHILFGKQGSYGISSLVKSTRAGINKYLEGFIPEENMRFRDHEIKFLSKPPGESIMTPKLVGFEDIVVKYDKFTLAAPKGELRSKEIIGVLGENGIGKTTFVKVLAGAIKPTTGSIDTEVSVSYKPQYLDSDNDELVAAYLANAISRYHTQLIVPLEIEPLITKQLNQLSGGELQRVSICKALSEDADLYLLDEPSAYLDIEQRLKVARVIRDFKDVTEKTLLVVDHDVVFVDYISDRLIVFEGVPSKQGIVTGPMEMSDGMNKFLGHLDITMRRDEESKRPRINKKGSTKDSDQKASGNLYYNT